MDYLEDPLAIDFFNGLHRYRLKALRAIRRNFTIAPDGEWGINDFTKLLFLKCDSKNWGYRLESAQTVA